MATFSNLSRPIFNFDILKPEYRHTREARTVVKEEPDYAENDISTELTLCSGYQRMPATFDFLIPENFGAPVHILGRNQDGPSTELVLYDESWWHVKKKLTDSDVSDMMRLILTTKSVQEHILPGMSTEQIEKMHSADGLQVKVFDVVEGKEHYLVFKKWKKPNSYVLISGWKQKFVQEKKLKEKDVIGLIWDARNTKFYFRVLSRN